MRKPAKYNKFWLLPLALIAAVGLYYLPPVHERLSTRLGDLRTKIVYFFRPPGKAVFTPGEHNPLTVETVVGTTRAEFMLTLTPQATATDKPGPTLTPTITPTALPAAVSLPGVIYIDQHGRWNYCGPANLTMALNFWGWKGNRDDVARVVKPGSGDLNVNFIDRGKPDKNVMPYELVDFVNEHTDFRALLRYGGDKDVLRRLISAGFPVIIEKGVYEKDSSGVVSWLGHYTLVTGYDDQRGVFIYQDTYPPEGVSGKNRVITYADFNTGWRAFDYIFVVVYPPADEDKVNANLGAWADSDWALEHALELANSEVKSLSGLDLYFAWFNKGTSHVQLLEYADAATAYDQAFSLYPILPIDTKDRPYRMMWYQTGPYFAYFYSTRYQDVINLADTTLNDTIATPTLEESLLWRGRAYYQIGNTPAAVDDYRAALKVHVGWAPAVQALADLGLQP